MRHHSQSLTNQGFSVHYSKLEPSSASFAEHVVATCHNLGITDLTIYHPADYFILQELTPLLGDLNLKTIPNPMFLTSRDHWEQYRQTKRRVLMADFYRDQRQRLKLLIDEVGKPIGGSWSYDEDNRKPLPKNTPPPPISRFKPDRITQEVTNLVKQYFAHHPGTTEEFDWPVTRNHALLTLQEFIFTRLENFGPYEDAISRNYTHLWHSTLSPLLNSGLLTPIEVIEAVHTADAPIASKEGFIRQVIGWREFIYQIAGDYNQEGMSPAPWGPSRRMANSWYNGTTGLTPLDHTIKRVSKHGYCHHIERLMILGSAMNLCQIDPIEAFNWFNSHFIDSADWVMAPNVYGMALNADGGKFATKPYISGSAYILKMSDYPKGPWCEIWDGLYWRFINLHRDRLVQNHRMSMIVRSFDKLQPSKRDHILTLAENFIDQNTIF
jgi:deoxyribodipyrimidine photolyase-related protein